MKLITEHQQENLNHRFLFFIVFLLFIINYSLGYIDSYSQLDIGLLFIGITIFVVSFILFVLFSVEKKVFKFLKKSIFSGLFIVILIIIYLLTAYLVHSKTTQKIEDIKLYNTISQDFKNIYFTSSLENALLLKGIVIVKINNEIDVEDMKNIIIKKYQYRDDLAFEFKLKYKEINSTKKQISKEVVQSYIVYNHKYFNSILSYIVLYFLLFIFIWSLDWTYKTYNSHSVKWKKVKELIGILFISFYIIVITLGFMHQYSWNYYQPKIFIDNKIYQYICCIKLYKDKKNIVILKKGTPND